MTPPGPPGIVTGRLPGRQALPGRPVASGPAGGPPQVSRRRPFLTPACCPGLAGSHRGTVTAAEAVSLGPPVTRPAGGGPARGPGAGRSRPRAPWESRRDWPANRRPEPGSRGPGLTRSLPVSRSPLRTGLADSDCDRWPPPAASGCCGNSAAAVPDAGAGASAGAGVIPPSSFRGFVTSQPSEPFL